MKQCLMYIKIINSMSGAAARTGNLTKINIEKCWQPESGLNKKIFKTKNS